MLTIAEIGAVLNRAQNRVAFPRHIGDDAEWEMAEGAIRQMLPVVEAAIAYYEACEIESVSADSAVIEMEEWVRQSVYDFLGRPDDKLKPKQDAESGKNPPRVEPAITSLCGGDDE